MTNQTQTQTQTPTQDQLLALWNKEQTRKAKRSEARKERAANRTDEQKATRKAKAQARRIRNRMLIELGADTVTGQAIVKAAKAA